MGIAQAMGFAMQTIGIITVAIRTGNWKGVTDNRIKDLEVDVDGIRKKVEKMDGRLNGMEKEFSRALARIETNLDFVKETLVELKNKDR